VAHAGTPPGQDDHELRDKPLGDGPGTPAGVRERVARASDPSLQDLLTWVDDETIAAAIRGVRDLERRWLAVPPGGKLKLVCPLARDFFAGATGPRGRQ
jgi:hypothetical protein